MGSKGCSAVTIIKKAMVEPFSVRYAQCVEYAYTATVALNIKIIGFKDLTLVITLMKRIMF